MTVETAATAGKGAGLALVARGAVAGLAAALAIRLFETAWSASPLGAAAAEPKEPPPTEVLADRVCHSLTGDRLHGVGKSAAGAAIHYATGAGLGVAYFLLARRWPLVAAGRGSAYGLAVWASVEEAGLVLLGLKPPPWRVEPAKHAFAAASHLVFGLTLGEIFDARSMAGAPERK